MSDFVADFGGPSWSLSAGGDGEPAQDEDGWLKSWLVKLIGSSLFSVG